MSSLDTYKLQLDNTLYKLKEEDINLSKLIDKYGGIDAFKSSLNFSNEFCLEFLDRWSKLDKTLKKIINRSLCTCSDFFTNKSKTEIRDKLQTIGEIELFNKITFMIHYWICRRQQYKCKDKSYLLYFFGKEETRYDLEWNGIPVEWLIGLSNDLDRLNNYQSINVQPLQLYDLLKIE